MEELIAGSIVSFLIVLYLLSVLSLYNRYLTYKKPLEDFKKCIDKTLNFGGIIDRPNEANCYNKNDWKFCKINGSFEVIDLSNKIAYFTNSSSKLTVEIPVVIDDFNPSFGYVRFKR